MKTTTITLKRIEPIKLGAVLGVTYCIVGVLVAIVVLFASNYLTFSAIGFPGQNIVSALTLPIGYGIGAFVLGAILAQVYNIVAKWTGGVEITIETSGSDFPGAV
ncbi:MAG: hypothetical protein ACLQPV_02665 [Vulcanimicrobiaceae bacterium]